LFYYLLRSVTLQSVTAPDQVEKQLILPHFTRQKITSNKQAPHVKHHVQKPKKQTIPSQMPKRQSKKKKHHKKDQKPPIPPSALKHHTDMTKLQGQHPITITNSPKKNRRHSH